MIQDKLDIFLITYNNERLLERTLLQIFSDDSPIKGFDITILDNHSTDRTRDVIEAYKAQNNNIFHIVHNKNIGGNANILRAFELAKKEYVWVLCDDDYYVWTNWCQVESFIEQKVDAICGSFYAIRDRADLSQIISQLTFLPAGIYRTDNITNTVLRNGYDNIWNFMPHLSLVFKLVNDNKKIFLIDTDLVKNGHVVDGTYSRESYIRGDNAENLFPLTRFFCWHGGWANSLSLLKDRNIALQCLRISLNKDLSGWSSDEVINTINTNATNGEGGMVMFWNFYYQCDDVLKRELLFDLLIGLKDPNVFFALGNTKSIVKSIIKSISQTHSKKEPLIRRIFSIKHIGRYNEVRVFGYRLLFRRKHRK